MGEAVPWLGACLPLAEHWGNSLVALSADRLSMRGSAGEKIRLGCVVRDSREWLSGTRLDGLHKPQRRAGAEIRVLLLVAVAVGRW